MQFHQPKFKYELLTFSDQMGNKGAFITLDGKTMKPQYTTYDAVVSK